MSALTKEQAAWIKRVQKALNSKGGEGLGFFTAGDTDVMVYDLTKEDAINSHHDAMRGGEFCNSVDHLDAYLGRLDFPAQVHSTAG